MPTRCPDYKLLGVVRVGLHPDWLAISKDGKCISLPAKTPPGVVVDNTSTKVVKAIPAASVPKRNASGMLRMQ